MSLATKSIAGTLTLGSIGGLGYFGSKYLQQGTEISELIDEAFEYKLLDTTEGDQVKDKAYWDINWRNYKNDNRGKENDIFGLEGWNKDNPGNSYSALKKKCRELSKTKISNNKDITYSNVTKYCGRGVTFAEQAAKDNLEILDTSGLNHGTIWTNRFTAIDETENDWRRLGINERPISPQEIKDGCNKAKERNKQEPDYANVYASYKLICAKQEGEE